MDEFGCFYESESLNDAPLIEATADSAPVRAPKRIPWKKPAYRFRLIVNCQAMPDRVWSTPRQTNGPPERKAA